MKKFLYVALMTFVMIGMSACSKDDDVLTGTKWAGQITETENGLTITADVAVEFTTETAGKMSVAMVMTDELRQMLIAFGMTEEEIAEMAEVETEDFTYTYDGESKGTITIKDEDGPDSIVNFTVDGDTLTLTEEGHNVVLTKQK